MPGPTSTDELFFQGPIALEHARFCLDCEVIFTDLACCPGCGGGVVWPLALWPSPGIEPRLAGRPALAEHDTADARAAA